MKSVAFIIPGRNHLPSSPEYQEIARIFKEKGIAPILVLITWKGATISDCTKNFLEQYRKVNADKKYVLGFSFGAFIAFLASTQVKFEAQILCSLSPYFAEDLPHIKKWWILSIGVKRYQAFKKHNNLELSKRINTKTFLLYGTSEGKYIIKRAMDTFKNLHTSKRLVEIMDVRHDIGNPKYIKAIRQVINSL